MSKEVIFCMVSTVRQWLPLGKTSKQNNTVSPRQERILQLLFLLMETIIEFRKNQVIKK